MKKFLSAVLSIVLIFTMFVPAFASNQGATITAKTPVIYISGDSNFLEYADENGKVHQFSIDSILDLITGDDDEEVVSSGSNGAIEAMFNILYPAIVEGIAQGKWDNYYKAVYNEITDFMGPMQLDNDGNAKPGSGIRQEDKITNEYAMTHDLKSGNGEYSEKAYRFYYDWRLDPRTEADLLHEYIEGVKSATGSDKVSISARCLGCNVIMCYIDKYGTDSLKGVALDVATSLGAEFLSGMISGDFSLNLDAISRFIVDATKFWGRDNELIFLATSLLDLLNDSGALDEVTKLAREKIYAQIEYGLISALSRAFMMTYPCYWALIPSRQYETAKEYVFGKENDPMREEYAGLIENIDSYNYDQKARIFDIYSELEKNDVNVCVVSKYGVQLTPVISNADIIADQYCSAYSSSLGATTADSIFSTLPASYIAEKEAQGLGKYISPDKQIDASTCLFPDNTWFYKGVFHGFYSNSESDLIMTVLDADHQLTVNDMPEYPQYLIFHSDTDTAEPMTEENCHNEFWYSPIDQKEANTPKLVKIIRDAFKFLAHFFSWIINALKEK